MTTFVYTYRHEVAQGDELRWSLRSIAKHFQGEFNIALYGQPPPWLVADIRITEPQHDRYDDTNYKLEVMAHDEELPNEFVLMMDDIVFCNAFDLEFLKVPRCSGPQYVPDNKSHNEWSKYLTHTGNVLLAKGRTAWNYATHLPQVYQRNLLQLMFLEFKIRKHRYIPEMIYGNMFRTNPQPDSEIQVVLNKKYDKEDIDVVRRSKTVLVHNGDSWNDALREWLHNRFPAKSRFEITDADFQYPETPTPSREEIARRMLTGQHLVKASECTYRGEIIEYVNGKKCGYKTPQAIYECSKFGKTALAQIGVEGISACNSCPVTLEKLGVA